MRVQGDSAIVEKGPQERVKFVLSSGTYRTTQMTPIRYLKRLYFRYSIDVMPVYMLSPMETFILSMYLPLIVNFASLQNIIAI
jgi:hypothetical protein